jgi:uncharacterized protein YceK
MKRTLTILTSSLLLCGCATVSAGTQPGVRAPQGVAPVYYEWDTSHAWHSTVVCDVPPGQRSVSTELAGSRAAVIATVVGVGTPVWNTPDGSRPTQAYLHSLVHPHQVNGAWPPQPAIYTPLRLRVQRSVHSQVATNLTAYIEGGVIGNDRLTGCGTTAPLGLRSTPYLILFGPELVSGARDVSVTRPVISDALAYNPASNTVEVGGVTQSVS